MHMLRKRIVLAVLVLGLVASFLLAGCDLKGSVTKVNLTGQLKAINNEVAKLNQSTGELVNTVGIMDDKEGQLTKAVELLNQVSAGTDTQLATIGELKDLTSQQNSKVTSILGTAQSVLTAEMGLQSGTETQLAMAGTTLDLIMSLYGNLNAFVQINGVLNQKLTQAVEIMQKM